MKMLGNYILVMVVQLCAIAESQAFSFFFFIYFYQLETNYFTVLQWFLSYIDMNQPWIYMYSPSRSPLPPPSPPSSSGSSQCTRPEHLSHASSLGSYAFSKGKFYDVSYLNFYIKRLYIDFLKSFKIILLFVFWLHWVFVAAHGLLLVVVSRGCSSLQCIGFSLQWLLVAEHGPQSTWAQLLPGMWDLSRPGLNMCPLHWQIDS